MGVIPVPPAIMPNSFTILGVYVKAPLGPFTPTVSPTSSFATKLETAPVGYDWQMDERGQNKGTHLRQVKNSP